VISQKAARSRRIWILRIVIGSYWFLLVATLHASRHPAKTLPNLFDGGNLAMTDTTSGWLEATIAGFRAMSASRHAAAARHWLAANDALHAATPHDPRRAASQANAGVAYILFARMDDADASLADAEQRWMRLLSHLASWDAPLRGQSSSFHFSLASRNLQAFQDAQRRRLARQCEAALAITRFNRLAAGNRPAADDAIVPALASLLSDVLGPNSPEVRLLRASEASPYADKVAAHENRHPPTPADDWQRLEMAAALTVLLQPGLPPAQQTGARGEHDAGLISPTATSSTSQAP
jgi:hypothetical protein